MIDKDWVKLLKKDWKKKTRFNAVSTYQCIDFFESLIVYVDRIANDLLFSRGFFHIPDENTLKSIPQRLKAKIVEELRAVRAEFERIISNLKHQGQAMDPTSHTYKMDGGATYKFYQKQDPRSPQRGADKGARTLSEEALSNASRIFTRKFLAAFTRYLNKYSQPIDFGNLGPFEFSIGKMMIFYHAFPTIYSGPLGTIPKKGDPKMRYPKPDKYVPHLKKAFALLNSKKLGYLWYGKTYIKNKSSSGENSYGKEWGVGGRYTTRDYITIFSNPGPYITTLMIHELGHRYYYRFLSQGDRAKFDSFFNEVDAVSAYGSMSTSEDFAEVFTHYVMNKKLTSDQRARFELFFNRTRRASRLALIIPPRIGKEIAMYRIFLKKMRQNVATFEKADKVFEKAEDLLVDAGLMIAKPEWDPTFLKTFANDLGDRKDEKAIDYEDMYYVRGTLRFVIEAGLRKATYWKRWATELEEALASPEFKENLPYYDLSASEVKALHEASRIATALTRNMEVLLKRMGRAQGKDTKDVKNKIPDAEIQDLETLYHASVNAKGIFTKGFSLKMPEEDSHAGLGGSSSVGGMKKGVSFTEDQHLVKAVSKTFKEMAMVARGEIGVEEILSWARNKKGVVDTFSWYHRLPRNERLNYERGGLTYERFKEGDWGDESSWERIPNKELFGDPAQVMAMYLSYLKSGSGYDPHFMATPKTLTKRFRKLNPRNIGYVKATIDMNNPDILYLTSEREFRVPPEAIVSVDKLIR